jgi:hypothetical protein
MAATSFYTQGPPVTAVTPPAMAGMGNMPPGPSVPAPAAAPMPSAPVNTNTPLHAAVRANPAITPQQIVSLHDSLTPPGAPPLSVQGAALVKQQALSSPPMPSSAVGTGDVFGERQYFTPNPNNPLLDAVMTPAQRMQQYNNAKVGTSNAASFASTPSPLSPPTISPNALGPDLNSAYKNAMAISQTVADKGPMPPGPVPSSGGFTPANANMSTVNGNAAYAPPTMPTKPNPLMGGFTPANANFSSADGTEKFIPPTVDTSKPPSTAPGAQPNHPSWLQTLGNVIGQVAPIVAGAEIGRSNPAAGAAALQGWQAGAQNVRAQAEQKHQQDIENQRQATLDKQNEDYRNATIKIDQEKVDAAKAAASDKLDASTEKQMGLELNNATSGSAALAIVNKYDPTGTKLTGMRQVLIGADGKVVDTNPFSTKAAAVAEKTSHDFAQENHWDAADEATAARVDAYAKQVGARSDELEALAGLAKSRKGYIDVLTKETVPAQTALIRLHNATADYLGVRTTDQPGLDQSLIGYRGALGDAATDNAETNRINSKVKAALAQEDINLDDARVKQIAGKDPAFSAALEQLKGAEARKQQAMLSATIDPVARQAIINAEDANIQQWKPIFNARMNGNGGTPASTAPVPHVPNVPNIATQPAGRQTPRSTAYKMGTTILPQLRNDTFGGSTPMAVRSGRVLGSMFGITDIGGRANPADRGTDGHVKDSDHYTGNALDFMTDGDSSKGQALADYAASHAKELGVKYVIWQQHIFNPLRASEGWRPMEDRRSPTANHMDHVHISFGGRVPIPAPSSQPAPASTGTGQVQAGSYSLGKSAHFDVTPEGVINGTYNGQPLQFRVPANKAEFNALSPVKKLVWASLHHGK